MAPANKSSGSTSEQARQYNERMIIQCVRQQTEISRAKLAKLTALSAQTISVITSSLIDAELLRVVGREYGGRGQPSIKLALNPAGAYGIGVNIDRDHISTSLVDFSGKLIHKYHHELLYPAVGQAAERVVSDLQKMRLQLGDDWSRVRGIGLAMPRKMGSWLDELGLYGEKSESRDALKARLKEWNQVDFANQLQQSFAMDVISENDAGAAALGELFFGLGHRYSSFFYLFFGMSLGGGIVNDGQYFRGTHGNAADFGLFPLADEAGRPTSVLMSAVSLSSLYRYLLQQGVEVSTPEQLQAFRGTAMESYIDDWLQQAAEKLVVPLFSVMATLDTEAVIFGGRLPPFIMEKLLRFTEDLCRQWTLPEQQLAPMLRSETGLDAAAVGAAILPLYETYAPMRERLLVKRGTS